MKILKKAGWFAVSMLPAILSLIMQFGCAFVIMLIYALVEIGKAEGPVSYDEAMALVLQGFLENAIYSVVLYHIMGVLVFGLWYYLAYGRKKRPAGAERPDAGKIGVIVLLGAGIQVFASGILSSIYILRPQLLQNYMDLMETAGITEFTLVTVAATVILAPLGEEFLCRGIIFRIAGKVSGRFWAANCIQAVAFGVIHGNLVQGAYAFLMGLALGYIYGKYRNIWLCVLLHGVINFMSSFVDSYFSLFPENYELPALAGNVAISLIVLVFCFKALGKRKQLSGKGQDGLAL